MDLSGTWSVLAADEETRRRALTPDTTTTGWLEAAVPGHWRSSPELADHDGPVVYRRGYRLGSPEEGRRRWIEVDGIFDHGDIWLDGAYLGGAEGYFTTTAYEITDLSRLGDDHMVAIEVSCPPIDRSASRRDLTGSYQSDLDRRWNPGGLAGAVRVVDTGPARIERCRMLCRDANDERAHLLFAARLDASSQRVVRVRTTVDGVVAAESEHRLARGDNEVTWTLDIARPKLWWPRALGERALYRIGVEVVVEGEISDRIERRTGLREISWDRWICSVNGERLFLKGANIVPLRLDPALLTDEPAQLMDRVVDAGLDAVRIHGHIAPDALYERADEAGVLILQDFVLGGTYARAARSRIVTAAGAAVDRLGHHPSLALWWANSDTEPATGLWRRIVRDQRPRWTTTVLEPWVRRTIEANDPTRPCIGRSGSLARPWSRDGGDSHLWFGWSDGELDGLAPLARTAPAVVRFVSEFGAAIFAPGSRDWRWPELDWDELEQRYGLDTATLRRLVPPEDHRSMSAWIDATRIHQAEVVRTVVETLRRLKYRPTGGFCVMSLNSPVPAPSPALIDADGTPTPGYVALREACRPVIVVADRMTRRPDRGQRVRLAVHVVNDLRRDLDDLVVTARFGRGDDRRTIASFRGQADADSCCLVGRLDLQMPMIAGEATLDLELRGPDLEARNSYRYLIV